jgi:capsule polysaccharide export protein KpsE/RkpR
MTDGQEINRLKLENTALQKRVQEAEGELSIVKGIGNNSPEMKSLKSEVQALKQQIHKEYETYQKEVALVREDAQVEILRLEKRNSEHQKLNGELQTKLSKYEDMAAHYRRKGVL